MSRLFLWFVVLAAATSAVVIADAAVRLEDKGFLILPGDFQAIARVSALGLWVLAGIALATREVKDAADARAAQQTKELQNVVHDCTAAVLKVLDHQKHKEINDMFREFGFNPPEQRKDEDSALCTGPVRISEFRRRRGERS
jgi:hypothetical protein